jgi:hypothetical protein
MKSDFFKGIVQWEIKKEGLEGSFKLPVFYYDNTSITAIYTASTSKVKKYLPHPEMYPVELFPGRCLVGFTAFEYRNTDINPYNEFSISIPISFGKKAFPGIGILRQMLKRAFTVYIWHLPVTTEIARFGGVELYGYPKFIAKIEFSEKGDFVECNLSEGNEHILTLRGKKLKTSKGKQMRYITYSIKDGIPLVANVFVNPIEFAQSMNPSSAEILIGKEHPICKELQEIELGEYPILYQYIPLNEAILFAPRNLIDR